MIKVVMRSIVTEETRSQAIELYKELIDKTIEENGCLKYELFCQSDNENNLALIEEWASRSI
ncbi:putative quinol monooxygenase [Neisseria sp. Ec49-e6-T10]|uniref:putative quinol monooxygenase n=1 Tax=Neisseria sp. Ec49-e6-T10 TaxID=3140744 RepID=UPI003EB85C40